MCFTGLQLKVLDGEKEQKGREVAELQTRLALEEQRDEQRGKEAFALKQKLTDAEMARDSLKKEVSMEKRHVQTHFLNCIKTILSFSA